MTAVMMGVLLFGFLGGFFCLVFFFRILGGLERREIWGIFGGFVGFFWIFRGF